MFVQKREEEGMSGILIKNMLVHKEREGILKLIYCFTLKLN